MTVVEQIYRNNSQRIPCGESSRTRDIIGLRQAVTDRSTKGKLAIIAEFKRSSPSGFETSRQEGPFDYFSAIKKGSISGFSVLTEPSRFNGSWNDLASCQGLNMPLLAKDFFGHERMIRDAYLSGADAVLLIADFLEEDQIRNLVESAGEYGMDALVEFHDVRAAKKIPLYENVILGYNRRDLRTMEMKGQELEALKAVEDTGFPVILESGIDSSNAEYMDFSGFSGLLIGSSLLKGEDVLGKLVKRGVA